MNSKFSNQELIAATLELYNETEKSVIKSSNKSINKKKQKKKIDPLLLDKELVTQKKITHYQKNKSLKSSKITNEQRFKAYKKKKRKFQNLQTLRLNKIVKYENKKYLLLRRIKNSDLKVIQMKQPIL
tara:strand:- start:24071 stop:24454 length:384 start_codon:yes stop_codon:yes gene_type:complete